MAQRKILEIRETYSAGGKIYGLSDANRMRDNIVGKKKNSFAAAASATLGALVLGTALTAGGVLIYERREGLIDTACDISTLCGAGKMAVTSAAEIPQADPSKEPVKGAFVYSISEKPKDLLVATGKNKKVPSQIGILATLDPPQVSKLKLINPESEPSDWTIDKYIYALKASKDDQLEADCSEDLDAIVKTLQKNSGSKFSPNIAATIKNGESVYTADFSKNNDADKADLYVYALVPDVDAKGNPVVKDGKASITPRQLSC